MPTTTGERRERVQIEHLPRDSSGRPMIPGQGRGTRRTPREVEERVIALAATTSMTQQEIAEIVGIPRRTVSEIIMRSGDDETFTRLRQEQKREWVIDAWETARELTRAAAKSARDVLMSDEPLTARDARDLSVAAGIMVDKTALVLGEAGSAASGGQTKEIADAVLGAWQAGREEGRREASPVNVTPGRVIDGAAEVR